MSRAPKSRIRIAVQISLEIERITVLASKCEIESVNSVSNLMLLQNSNAHLEPQTRYSIWSITYEVPVYHITSHRIASHWINAPLESNTKSVYSIKFCKVSFRFPCSTKLTLFLCSFSITTLIAVNLLFWLLQTSLFKCVLWTSLHM